MPPRTEGPRAEQIFRTDRPLATVQGHFMSAVKDELDGPIAFAQRGA